MNFRRTSWMLVLILSLVILGPTSAQQGGGTYTVGFLSWFGLDAFKQEMASLGYIEGQNITYMSIDYSSLTMDSPPEAFGELYNSGLQAMVDAQVDVFVTLTDSDIVPIKEIIGNTPVIFSASDDPVATGIVQSLIAPGGNATGLITNRPHERRLQILTEIKPATERVYYLYSVMTGEAEVVLQQVQAVGANLGVEIIPAPITDVPSALDLLENTPDDIDWLFLTPYVPFDFQFSQLLSEVSLSHHAGITGVTDAAVQGYLMGYGPNSEVLIRRCAHIADLIFRGADPATIPVETAENYLMVNLEAAESIGMSIPESILRQASLIVRPGYFETLAVPFPGA